ncbi:hypothetical protein J2T60_000653 [Natronospira proteinivora]|uniref:L,D-TPase catalytic domain-containing protein n=1 Tax=Natronospira proteinivora TaxID=1807133 RepID=A0ABT1G5W5_9GAMM|nr:L,D-transpeptidase [Natronospira proteinivora]MCP1726688.1 hypothetical protein [Natronospira proteinivora]
MRIEVDISCQRLTLYTPEGRRQDQWPVSTAKNGPGEGHGSGCTPRGRHVIRARIGDGQAVGTVFVGRRPTGEICDEALFRAQPERDWILTRILWLSGLEPGKNRLGDVDTMRRYIYIHGCPDAFPMGKPLSAGCIRMRNHAVIALFEQVSVGTEVLIKE